MATTHQTIGHNHILVNNDCLYRVDTQPEDDIHVSFKWCANICYQLIPEAVLGRGGINCWHQVVLVCLLTQNNKIDVEGAVSGVPYVI